jgi:hypothetical protein
MAEEKEKKIFRGRAQVNCPYEGCEGMLYGATKQCPVCGRDKTALKKEQKLARAVELKKDLTNMKDQHFQKLALQVRQHVLQPQFD